MISRSSIGLVAETGISETAFGALFTAVATSLPELVVAVAAVRIGALNLAIGNIIGGNAFDVLFLAVADLACLPGSLYAEFNDDQVFLTVTVIAMTGVLLLGLLRRERHGVANIGWESVGILLLYAMSVLVLFLE